MKKIVILAMALSLFGCGSDTPSDTNSNTNIDSETIETVDIGATCGGIEDIKCSSKLMCKREKQVAEAMGTCVDTVIDKDLECAQTKAPVCGLKDRNKNGYLNECEARRHGAEILNEGFCKIEPEKKNNCKAHVLGIGNCELFAIGYEFDGKQCQEVGVAGCEAEIPFATMKDCQMECL